MKLVKPALIIYFIGVHSHFLFAQSTVTISSLLKEITNPSSIAEWPTPFYREMQFSSYDRRSKSPSQPGWFANNDASQFIRTEESNGHKEYVMMDADGPGAIIRFWITTFKREGTLRIYFDNQSTPEIIIPAYDLMKINLPIGKGLLMPHSSYEPTEKGGSTLYLPMPFKKHCKVTWQEAGDSITQPRYYQINYRKYNAGTPVQTFTIAGFDSVKALAEKASQALLKPGNVQEGKHFEASANIAPGKTIQLISLTEPAAIKLLNIKLTAVDDEQYAQALHTTFLKIKFDGTETVNCPLDVFSGSGIDGQALQSWYRTVTYNHDIISRWVMPYKKQAVITIENTGTQVIQLSVAATTTTYTWDEETMYFHADWKQENNVVIKKFDTADVREWNFNTIQGRGIFVGETFAVNNHMHYWYGEGDQKIWVDKDSFPSEFSTGTEDYYNTSWAPVVLYQTPFANAPKADNKDSYGDNTFTRTRNLDAIPFKHNFTYTLEMLGWDNGTIDISAVTYWYGFGGAQGKN